MTFDISAPGGDSPPVAPGARRLTVRHITEYRYARPVTFGEHQVLFRPRDSHDLRLVEAHLAIVPAARVRWVSDVFGNSIAVVGIDEASSRLRFKCRIKIDHLAAGNPEFPLAPEVQRIPFRYPEGELPDLAASITPRHAEPGSGVAAWARRFLDADGSAETMPLLARMTRAVKEQLAYHTRHEPGVQTPDETLLLGSGTCRDYAHLMMEAARSLGLAARFVTGYLYDPALDGGAAGTTGAGSTHAWVQIYLTGAGWVEFDPTNGSVGSANLIRVGVARDPAQAVPLQGSYTGAPADFLEMHVSVEVTAGRSRRVANGMPG
jgi:transglutaminase-like putative cysteine protease